MSFLARFMTVYACVIAVTKDLPDIEGDKAGGIQTFALTYGAKKVAGGAALVLGLNYVGAVATALLAAPGTCETAMHGSTDTAGGRGAELLRVTYPNQGAGK